MICMFAFGKQQEPKANKDASWSETTEKLNLVWLSAKWIKTWSDGSNTGLEHKDLFLSQTLTIYSISAAHIIETGPSTAMIPPTVTQSGSPRAHSLKVPSQPLPYPTKPSDPA